MFGLIAPPHPDEPDEPSREVGRKLDGNLTREGRVPELAWFSEDNPMLMSFRNLVLSSAALCTTAAFAAEQTRVEVPFSFVAKNHAYQAGSYTVTVDWTKSLVTLSRNREAKPATDVDYGARRNRFEPSQSQPDL